MSLFKQKIVSIKPDFVVNLMLIIALLTTLVYPKNSVEAENVIMANLSQNIPISEVQTVLADSPEGRLFFPEVRIPNKQIKANISFYSSTPDQTDDSPFIAADGTRVYDGMVANNCLPFGTEIKIPSLYGDKIFVVHDRMNKRYGCSKFDIWMDASKAELFKLGLKRAEIEVYYVKKSPKTLVSAK